MLDSGAAYFDSCTGMYVVPDMNALESFVLKTELGEVNSFTCLAFKLFQVHHTVTIWKTLV